MRRLLFVFLLILLGLLIGLVVGITIYRNLTIDHWDQVAPGILFEATDPLPIPVLADLTAGTANESEALAAVVEYADTHDLTILLDEPNPIRARALWVMYQAHTAALYGSVEVSPNGLLDFVALKTAHCGSYADAQALLLTALAIEWRRVEITGGTHQFIEVKINGRWEITDATANVWIDTSAYELMNGSERTLQTFYTPALDPDYTSDYAPEMLRGVLELRASLPLLGVGWQPKALIVVTESDVGRWDVPPR